jgi:alpha-tubulin suppressor-like RCC1 family protein
MFRQMSAGNDHTCGVTPDNRAYCWGFNWAGQIGDGSTGERFPPTAVAGGLQFSQVSVGLDHSCGVTVENHAYCWGRNDRGQLGDGTFDNRSTPVAVVGGLHFREVKAGMVHTCGIVELTDVAYCWGSNNTGDLGDGTTGTNRASPVLVLGGLHWAQLSAGGGHTCGVTTENRPYCWGGNTRGQLGDGTVGGMRSEPSPVVGGFRIRQVSAGGVHSCGVTTGNQVYCWGENGTGQLGDGTKTSHAKPTLVPSSRPWNQVSAGAEHTCALTLSQRAWCWGSNAFGRLGDATTIDRLKPVLVGKGMPFRQVTAGTFYSCGVSRSYQGYCWGDNTAGEIGVTPAGQYPSPVRVTGPM